VSLDVTILGCGSSGGVPRVAQGWGACDPANPKNRRRRCSILVEQQAPAGVTSVLVDTSPDLREQLLAAEVGRLDGVLMTHSHADHTHGIDDLRPIVIAMRRRVEMHMDQATSNVVTRAFPYIFASPPGSLYPPLLTEKRIRAGEVVTIAGHGGALEALPIPLEHGEIPALGFRFGALAYTPDLNAIPDRSVALLENLDVWIIDGLRHAAHPTHLTIAQALEWIERLKPARAIITNMHNDLDYEMLRAELPPGVEPAFDGMRIHVD